MSTIYKPKKLNNFSKKNKPKNNKLNNKQITKINVNRSNNFLKTNNQKSKNINKINNNISPKKKDINNNNNNLYDEKEKEKLLNEIIKKYEEKNNIIIDEKIANILINNINLNKKYFFPKNFTKIFFDQKHKTNSFNNLFHSLFYSHNLIKLINQSNLPQIKKSKTKTKFFNRRIFDYYYYNEKQNPRNPTILKCNTNVYQGNRRRSSLQLFGHGLTKMPQYQKKHLSQNYDMEYDYAKKAAVHVRRLEYAYRIKPIIDFHKILLNEKASLIQQWWRALMQCQLNYYLISKIQSLFKGYLCRKIKKNCIYQINYVLPFIYKIINVYYKNRIKYFFIILFKNFALKFIAKHVFKKCLKIQNKFRKYYLNKRVKNDKELIFSKNYKNNLKFKNLCVFKKLIFDQDCNEKIKKIQSIIKGYLLRNNEKIMRKIGYNINPYLYFNLKYNSNKNKKDNYIKNNNDSNSTDINDKHIFNEKNNLFKKKLSKFNQCFNKLKLFNLKVNKKINNEFEFFKKMLQKKLFKNMQNKYENLFNNKKILKNLIEKKLKKFFIKKWFEKKNKINNLENLIIIKNNDLCNQKIKYLKKKIFKFEKEKIFNNLEKNLNKILLRNILINKLMLKYSKKYFIKIVFNKILKRIFNDFYNKLKYYNKIKIFYNKLFKNLDKIKYFKKWSNFIYNKNNKLLKYFILLKIKRLLNKNQKKLFIKKYLKKWNEKIKYNQEENLNKINKKYLLLIKLKQWKEISKNISLKYGKLKKIILNVNKINNKFFEQHCVKYFYDKWHLYSIFYIKYLNEFEKLKIRFFVNILFDSVINKKYLKYKSFFIRKLSNNKIINSYLINNKDENFNKEINNNFFSQNSNDELFLENENLNEKNNKNLENNFSEIENKNLNLIYKKNIIKDKNNEFHKINNKNISNKENNKNESKQNEFQQKLIKLNLLKKIILNCNSKKLKLLKNYFYIFKKNLSMNYIKIFHTNIQINFLYKNKKYMINKKYRMLNYIIFKINNKMKNKTLKKYLYNLRYKIIKLCLNENKNYKYMKYIIFLQKKIKNLIQNKKI